MSSFFDCQPSDSAQIAVLAVGIEQSPVIQIERATTRPFELTAFARERVEFLPVRDNLYPGLRAPMPLEYVRSMVSRLDPLIRHVFALRAVSLVRAECFFSIVATRPEDLVPLQMVPHIDTSDPLHFATVHYLCPHGFGGTAFFRQVSTGFETIVPEREQMWNRARDASLRMQASAGYPSADTPDHEITCAIPAEFDRLIVYPSNVLHAGIIKPHIEHPGSPHEGRLTATMFISYRPSKTISI